MAPAGASYRLIATFGCRRADPRIWTGSKRV